MFLLLMLFIIIDISSFCNIRGYFLFKHFTLYKFCKNIFSYNKIYTLSKVISFCLFEIVLLLLDKIFSYYFLICQ